MRRVLLPLLAAAACLAPLASAHDDAPEVFDRRPPFRGPAWRAAQAGVTTQALAASVDFPASGVTLLSWLPLAEFGPEHVYGNDCWGYVSPSGREYAILGLSHGTGFVDVTDPADAQVVEVIAGPPSLWRDVKTHGEFAYAVSEGGGGIQVIDLRQIDAGVVLRLTDVTEGGETPRTHNVAIDEESGFLYRCGGPDNGLRIYDLATPEAPAFVASWSDRYVHDAQVVTYTSGPWAGRQIAFCCAGLNNGEVDTGLEVLDVTDKQAIQVLSHTTWPGAAYSHQAWLSDDRTLLYVNDELDEDGLLPTTTYVIDVADPSAPAYLTSFTNGNPAIGHNLYVRGDRLFEANYRSGLRVFDLGASALAPPEVASFDTWPEDDADEFNGAWSVYPFLPSEVVVASDIEKGLFVLWVGEPLLAFSHPLGLPATLDPAGDVLRVHVDEATPGALDPSSVELHLDDGFGVQTLAMTPVGGDDFEAALPPLPCGAQVAYAFTARSANGITWRDPSSSAADAHVAAVAPGLSATFADDMEQPTGWTVGAPSDTAWGGLWVREDPVGNAAQPDDDHTPGAGGRCWLTGQTLTGQVLDFNDVDGGATTLTSPPLDMSGAQDPVVRYWRWFSNAAAQYVGEDVLLVDVSNDGGQSWTSVEVVGPDGPEVKGGWVFHAFRVREHVTPTADVRVRFVAADFGNPSIVEAAVDDFEVVETTCPDCDGDGVPDGLVLALGGAVDFDGNGVPDPCDPLAASTDALSLSAGGSVAFTLRPGAAFAGDYYWMLGSASGTAPGTPLGAVVVPLVYDPYFALALFQPFAGVFTGFLSLVDPLGEAAAGLTLPAASDPSLAGVTLHHAYVTADVLGQADFVSNAQPLTLVP